MPRRNWVATLIVDSSHARGIDDVVPAEETAARARTRARQGGLDPAVAARRTDPYPAGAVPAARLHLSESENAGAISLSGDRDDHAVRRHPVQLLKLMG